MTRGGTLGMLSSGELQTRTDDRLAVRFDPTVDEPTVAVVSAVATLTNTAPDRLELLHESIDTGALDQLAKPTRSGHRRQCRIALEFAGCEVLNEIDDTVVVHVERSRSD